MKDGGPAFPAKRYEQVEMNGVRNDAPMAVDYPGMTLRDYFAAAALTGWLADGHVGQPEEDAKRVYRYADAMLAAREES